MASLAEALAGLGIAPQPGQVAARPSNYGGRRPVASAPAAVPGMPATSVGGRIQYANATPLQITPVSTANPADDSGGIGGFFKNAASGVMDALDFARGYGASGVKELTDTIYGSRVGHALDKLMGVSDEERAKELERMGTGSWNDFLEQGDRGIGFRDVLDEVSPETKGDVRWAPVGFLGDMIVDPLTYLTLGTSTAAGKGIEGSMRVAVADGSGRMLSKELATTAMEKGILETPGVRNVIADAAVRGNGAITARGLARNGVDDVTREALGIPNLARTIGKDGVRIPGSRVVANAFEDVKGGAKRMLRTTDSADVFRRLGQNKLGARNLDRIIFSRAATVGERADAVVAKTTINNALASARSWAVDAEHRIIENPSLGRKFTHLSADEGRALTHAIERGEAGGMADSVREALQGMRTELQALGVDVGDLGPNYVPHMVSDEFRALARKNTEAARVLVALDSDVGFQMKRVFGVNPGQESTFMGEKLVEGTIEEMNGISLKKVGAKVFVDDVRDTLPRYIGQMADAAARAQQIKLLTDRGLVRELAVKEVEKAIPRSADEVAALKAAKAQLKAARAEEKIALADGTVLRRKELGAAREAVQSRRMEIARQVDAIDDKLRDVARNRMTVETRLKRALAKQESIQHSLDEWTKVVKSERGPARRKALAQVKKLQAELENVGKAVEQHGNQLERLGQPGAVAKKAAGVIESSQHRDWILRDLNDKVVDLSYDDPVIGEMIDTQDFDVISYVEDAMNTEQKLDVIQRGYPGGIAAWQVDHTWHSMGVDLTANLGGERLAAQRAALNGELDTLRAKADELLLKQNPPGQGPLPSDRRVAQASASLQAAQLKSKGLMDDVTAATEVFDAALAEHRLTIEQLNLAEHELDRIWDKVTKMPDKDRVATQALAQEYRDRVTLVTRILKQEGLDDASKVMATLEAQAMIADIRAMQAGRNAVGIEQLIGILSQPKVQTEIHKFVEPGMNRIGETLQIPGWLDEALKVEPVRMNAIQANKFVRKFYNLWKGYAILRPGFHVRNAYSGMFNIYLEAGPGAFANIRRAHQFDVLAMKHPDQYLEMATKRWGDEEAQLLNQAYMAMRATGAGQAAGEFTSAGLHAGKLNLLSSDNVALKESQRWGEWVERHLRVTHAYDVMKRGGTLDQAIDTVNKWHFNYTDISQFDQNMKLVMPFWTFYSRNIALQAQTWVRSAQKLNRVYVNAQRNLSHGEEDDQWVPEWFSDAGAIRLPGGDAPNGPVPYLFPDIPAMQFPGQLDKFTTPWTGEVLGDVGPVKLPLEIMAGKQFFSGIPFKNQPTEAGIIGQGLNAVGLGDTARDGTPMLNDELQYAINSMLPGFSQLDRLTGQGGDSVAERRNKSILAALTGISVRDNNDRTRRGEQYRQSLEAENEAARRRALGF